MPPPCVPTASACILYYVLPVDQTVFPATQPTTIDLAAHSSLVAGGFPAARVPAPSSAALARHLI